MAGRKEDLIIRIRLLRNRLGKNFKDTIDSTKGYYRKTVTDLQAIYGKEYNDAKATGRLD